MEISTVDLSYVATVKSKVEIFQNFGAFSEYMNCKEKNDPWPCLENFDFGVPVLDDDC